MLTLKVPASELWDEAGEEYIYTEDAVLELEHSLKSMSLWEEKWHKAFLSKKEKTYEEYIDYIRCMTLTPDIDPNVYKVLRPEHIKQIEDYINDPHTATYFNDEFDEKPKGKDSVVTSELIYYWMSVFNIPSTCENWHLNRLLVFIKLASIKSSPPKKMTQKQLLERHRRINEYNRRKFKTKG